LWEDLAASLPGARLLGPPGDDPRRLPGTLNVLLPGVDGKVLVTRLDLEGLELSAGSACASGSLEPSHVLLAMGLGHDDARAGLRISIGRDTTLVDVRQAVETLRRTLS
jgi:cysteine desulfurase